MADALTDCSNNGGGDDEPNRRQDSSNEDDNDVLLRTPTKRVVKPKTGGEETSEDSSDASTAVTSTALTLHTPGSIASYAGSQSHQTMEVDVRRERLQHQMLLLTMTTTATLAMFVITIIPFTILIAFGMFATSAGLLSYVGFERLVLEYQAILAGDGLAQFLPASLMQQLTETSLHQFMRDDTFAREWGFLALYFVPGLTEDQLNDYIRRLAPDHRVMLNRPGMGHFLPDPVMRALVGERRWRQDVIVANVPTIEHPSNQEIVVRSRVLDFDIDADSQASAPVGLTVPSNNAAENATTPPNDEERRHELAGESDVIMNAVWDGIANYANAVTAAVTDQVLAPVAGIATTVGLISSIGVTVLSLGTGLWQYNRASRSPGQQQQSRPILGLLFSSTVLGGMSTGVMLYARSAVKKSTKPPQSKDPPK